MAKAPSLKKRFGVVNSLSQEQMLGNQIDYKKHLIASASITFFAFIFTLRNGFVNIDDPVYLELAKFFSFQKAFLGFNDGNYFPITLSLQRIEYLLFGENAALYHLTSSLIHTSNVIMLFFIVLHITKKQLAACIIGLLFGIHTMHVESVAWMAEQKDLLYVFWYFASILAYLKYLQNNTNGFRYWLMSLICFALSIGSKGQAVMLSGSLFLIDYLLYRKLSWKMILEKIPFLTLSVLGAVIAIYAQDSAHGINSHFPVPERIIYAGYAFTQYLSKLIPTELSIFYTYPNNPSHWYLVAAIIGVTMVGIKYRKDRVVVFGLGFFLLHIIPLLQLIPVGSVIIADRYSYLSYTGLFFIAGVKCAEYWEQKKSLRPILAIAGSFVLVFLFGSTWARTVKWQNSETLALNSEINSTTLYVLGIFYEKELRDEEKAHTYFMKSFELGRDDAELRERLGVYYTFIKGKEDSALIHLRKAIDYNPSKIATYYGHMGMVYISKGIPDSALHYLSYHYHNIQNRPADLWKATVCIAQTYDYTYNNQDSATFYYNRTMEINPTMVSEVERLQSVGKASRNKNVAP